MKYKPRAPSNFPFDLKNEKLIFLCRLIANNYFNNGKRLYRLKAKSQFGNFRSQRNGYSNTKYNFQYLGVDAWLQSRQD